MANIFDLFKKIEKKESTAPITHIVVGLGNIGAAYARTRHNIGFVALDHIAAGCGASVSRVKFNATVGEGVIGGARVLLMKPSTLMNASGIAIKEAADFYKIPPEKIIVLHDEISFDPGVIRIRRKGSAGGHNGLKSIIKCLSSEEFPRVKIGVGQKPSPDYDLADWVLGKLPDEDAKTIAARLDDIKSATELIVKDEIDAAMGRYPR
jgi:PTH1 family peptidyl-tRNA hydrolase